jgi:hypothetical protein
METKQTAVEWFAIQLYEQGYFDGSKPKSITNLDHLQEQAKQMEKNQIERDFINGYKNANVPLNHKLLDKYYNETYGK